MRNKNGFGTLILFEGLDGGGKTTAARKIAEDLKFTYIKGLGGDNFFGRIAKKYAKTFLFLLEIIYVTYFPVRKALKMGGNVLLDKYFFAAASHIPDVNTPLNQFLIKLCQKFIIRPDFVIYFQVSPEERIRRLKMGSYNKFHKILVDNPQWMIKRERTYADLVRYSHLFFHFFDNTKKTAEQTVEDVEKLIKSFLEMKEG
jgi:thymidylate kinase